MKIKISIILFLFTISQLASSQELALKKSEIFKDIGRDSELVFYDEDPAGNLFVLRKFYAGIGNDSTIYLLEHYNSALEKIKVKEFQNEEIRYLFVKNGYIHLVLIEEIEDDKKFYYKVIRSAIEEFRFESFKLMLNEDFQLAGTENTKKNIFAKGFFDQAYDVYKGEIVLSKNKNFIGISFQLDDRKNETHRIAVFDLNFEKIFEKELQLNLKDKRYEFNSLLVDDEDGSVYFLGKYIPDFLQQANLGTEMTFNFNLFKIDKTGQETLEFKTNDQYISSLKLLKNDNQLICAGFYSDAKNQRKNGIVYCQVSKDSFQIEKKRFFEIKDKQLKNLKLKKIILDDQNNDLYVAGEQLYGVNTPQHENQFNNHSNYKIIHFDNIYVAKVDRLGNLAWSYSIDKKQSSGSGDFVYFSYLFDVINAKPYLIFNAKEKEIKSENDDIKIRSTSLNKMFLYALTFEKNGNHRLKLLHQDKSDKMTFKVLQGLSNDKSFLLEGNYRSKKQILKID